MSRAGQPLRFIGLIVGGWVVMRIGVAAAPMLWALDAAEQKSIPSLQRAVAAHAKETAQIAPLRAVSGTGWRAAIAPGLRVSRSERITAPGASALSAAFSPGAPGNPSGSQPNLAASPSAPLAQSSPPPPVAIAPSPATAAAPQRSRWSLTGWLLWRRDGGASLAQAPLLGGSQAGLRLDYRLWGEGTRSLSAYGRLTRALERPFAEEVAVGLAFRPIEGLPVSLLAERRQRLGAGGRSGFALMAAGGIGPREVAPRVELEGYAQAGIVGAPGADAFADGRLSLGYRLAPKGRGPDIALGLAVSGGAQPGAARLDVGPELRMRLPVAGGHVRLSAEWRQRVAGAARPSSGPAITLVTEF